MRQDTFIGKQIGDFIVQERLSRGSRSMVFRAFQLSESRDVALKITRIDRRLSADSGFRERFKKESENIATFEHPHILRIYTAGIEPDLFFLAMRLTRGGSLAQFLQEHPNIDISLMTRIITQLGQALAYAHRRGVIHHDLKPTNILLDVDHNAYLTDFGFTKRVLKEDVRIGSPLYASPEQLKEQPLTPRSDVFSLGMILYRMAVGRLPYENEDETIGSLLQRHITERPPSPQELNADVPPVLNDIIMKAIERDPNRRYKDTEELILTLNRELEGLFETPDIDDTPSSLVPKLNTIQPSVEETTGTTSQQLMPYSIAIIIMIVVLGVTYVVLNPPVPPPVIIEDRAAAAEAISVRGGTARLAQYSTRNGGFIAYVSCNTLDENHVTRIAEIEQRAEMYGIPVRVYDSAGAPELEIEAVQQAHKDGASAIIHCVVGPTTIGDSLAAAAADDIALVVDSELLADDVDDAVFITKDEFSLGATTGKAAGEYINETLPDGADVVILTGASDRTEGIIQGLQEAAPQANITAQVPGNTTQLAKDAIESLIGDEQDFDVILTTTDNAAYGVIQALDGSGYLPDEVAIFSIDAEMLARQYIEDGYYIKASAHPDDRAISNAMVDAAVIQLGGGALPQRITPGYGALVTAELTND